MARCHQLGSGDTALTVTPCSSKSASSRGSSTRGLVVTKAAAPEGVASTAVSCVSSCSEGTAVPSLPTDFEAASGDPFC